MPKSRVLVEECVHHWMLDYNGLGRCCKCNEMRKFPATFNAARRVTIKGQLPKKEEPSLEEEEQKITELEPEEQLAEMEGGKS